MTAAIANAVAVVISSLVLFTLVWVIVEATVQNRIKELCCDDCQERMRKGDKCSRK